VAHPSPYVFISSHLIVSISGVERSFHRVIRQTGPGQSGVGTTILGLARPKQYDTALDRGKAVWIYIIEFTVG